MSYTPNTWQDGDTITAEKLNNMETPNVPFIVNLTPTREDYSGTMDKTNAEILAAYDAGQKIVFRMWLADTIYYEAVANQRAVSTSVAYPAFMASVIDSDHNLIFLVLTPAGDSPTNAYATVIYTMTPMGG